MKLIFNHVGASNAIAQYLRGDWDGFNAVQFDRTIDLAALRQAIALVKLELNMFEAIEYCWVGEICSLFRGKTIGGKSIGYLEYLLSVYGSEAIRELMTSSCATRVIFNPQELASAEEFVERL